LPHGENTLNLKQRFDFQMSLILEFAFLTLNHSYMKKPFYLLILLALISITKTYAQCSDPGVFCMDTETNYSCEGILMDAGGDGTYPEESQSMTLCPATDGYRTSITFTSFDLDEGTNPDESDQIVIYDGTNEQSPLIGIYSGGLLNGLTISASNGNPSGCLLIQFIAAGAENTSHSGWSATITCTQPCMPPVADATLPDALFENSIFLNCSNELADFSAANSTAAPGHSIVNYEWDFKDGSLESSTTPSISHQYDYPAIYDVRLVVYDETGCADETFIHVGMIGAPIVNLPSTMNVCVGSEVSLAADFEPLSINNSNHLTNDITLFLPDGAGFSYQTEIFVNGYQGNAVINSCDDFNGIFVNMEHSYMGDLNIALTCPNGTTVNLVEWGVNGLGGTFLGEPIDDEFTEAGVGYDYSWTSESANGTWGEYIASNGITTLPSGDYNSEGDLCSFVGCPYNGTWSLVITDNLIIDNGYIFNWGIELATGSNAGALEYTPTISEDATSSFWSGEGITSLSENADEFVLNTTAVGPLALQYTTIDNVGCTFTQDYTVSIIENPIIITLEDYFNYDANNTYLYPQTSGIEWPNVINWSWTPADGLSNPTDQFTEVLIPNDNDTYTVTATSPSLIGCSATETIAMTLPELVVSGFVFNDVNQNGIFDTGESPIPNFPFIMNNTGSISFSDENGFYSAFCTYGSNTVSITPDATLWISTTPTMFTADLTNDSPESINNNFGIVPNSNPQTIIEGFISNSNTWCLFNNTQYISVVNEGNTQPSGHVVYTYDPLCTFLSASPTPYLIDGNNLYFAFDALGYSSATSFEVTLDMPDNSENGDQLNFSLQTFYQTGTGDELASTDPVVSPLLCSYDPNDVRELNGTGPQGNVAPNTTLDYVIRFQNTGSAVAYDVVILDQLPQNVVASTLQPIASSHPCTISVNANGIATFNFDNINLPDSTTSFNESIGYIHFRLDQQPNLSNGTIIPNTAQIFFDANSPVTTNTCITTIYDCPVNTLTVSVDENNIEIVDLANDIHWYHNGQLLPTAGYVLHALQSGDYYAEATLINGCIVTSEIITITSVGEQFSSTLQVFPNPASDVAYVQLGNQPSNVTIRNSVGQLISSWKQVSKTLTIPCTNLPSGSYVVCIENSDAITNLQLIVK
jgi:uncharacterized repeat protein (TIGR01451 family)